MRILLGVHAFPPQATAGVEVYTLRLAKALQSLGHSVLVLSAAHDLAAAPGTLRRRVHEGVDIAEVVNLHHRGTLQATYDDPDVDAAAERVLREFRPAVVHLQHLLNLSVGVVRLAKQLGAAVLWTLHDYWLTCPRDGQRRRADGTLCEVVDHAVCARCLGDSPYLIPPVQSGVAGALRRVGAGRGLHVLHDLVPAATEGALRVLRRMSPPVDGLEAALGERVRRLTGTVAEIDLLLAPTEFVRSRTLETGVAPEKVRLLSYGAVSGPTRARRAGRRPRVGFVGSVAPHKGVHVLVAAVRRMVDPGVRLDVYGSLTVAPAYAESLRALAGPDARIRFHGGFPEGGQARVLETIDVLAVPSTWWENSPLTALEALAAGVPVVASRIGGVPELIEDGRTGRLVAPDDPQALGEALAAVASGQDLGEALPPLPLKTVEAGARELLATYAALGARATPA